MIEVSISIIGIKMEIKMFNFMRICPIKTLGICVSGILEQSGERIDEI